MIFDGERLTELMDPLGLEVGVNVASANSP